MWGSNLGFHPECQRTLLEKISGVAYGQKSEVLWDHNQKMLEFVHGLKLKYLLCMREQWSSTGLLQYQVGDVIFILDTFKSHLSHHKLGIILNILPSADGEQCVCLVSMAVNTGRGTPNDPIYRKMVLSRDTRSISAPIITAMERQKSVSKFFDLTNFYEGFIKFVSESETSQLTGFDNIRLREDLPGDLLPSDSDIPDPKNNVITWDDKFTQGKPPSQSEIEVAWDRVTGGDAPVQVEGIDESESVLHHEPPSESVSHHEPPSERVSCHA
jgi:hypothetical protein